MAFSHALVQLLHTKRAAGVPRDLAEKVRLHIADDIGICLAARRAMVMGKAVTDALAPAGTSGSSAVLGGPEQLQPASAAFVNSALGHMLDYDDMHDAARMHPTTVTFPAALAAAQLVDARGSAVIEAVALGNELMCRLGLLWSPKGSGPASNWFLSQFFGYFGACVAAGIVLGLSEQELVSAFGLAYMQVAGGKEPGYGVDSTARSIYPAFASMGGVNAAFLARSGLIGPPSAFDGTAGLFRIYFNAEPDAEAVAKVFNDDGWVFEDAQIKPWPSCRLSHSYIAAAFAVRDKVPREPVERVVVAVNASAAKLCRPMDVRCRPRTIQDAKHSLPFMTAFALVHGKVDLENLVESALTDDRVLDMAARIEPEERLPDTPGNPPAEIEVHTARGCVKSPQFTDTLLDVTEAQVREKFLACVSYAGQGRKAVALWEHISAMPAIPVIELLRAIPVVAYESIQSTSAIA